MHADAFPQCIHTHTHTHASTPKLIIKPTVSLSLSSTPNFPRSLYNIQLSICTWQCACANYPTVAFHTHTQQQYTIIYCYVVLIDLPHTPHHTVIRKSQTHIYTRNHIDVEARSNMSKHLGYCCLTFNTRTGTRNHTDVRTSSNIHLSIVLLLSIHTQAHATLQTYNHAVTYPYF